MSKHYHTSELKREQDLLWVDHFYLTRQLIIAAVSKSPCLSVFLADLMQNQENLGNNFAQLTNRSSAGKNLTRLLKEHISIAVEIVTAAIQGQSITQLNKGWRENAKEIAECYHHYNKAIGRTKMTEMMLTHLQTTLNEATAIIVGDCVKSSADGNVALTHIHMMSDFIISKF